MTGIGCASHRHHSRRTRKRQARFGRVAAVIVRPVSQSSSQGSPVQKAQRVGAHTGWQLQARAKPTPLAAIRSRFGVCRPVFALQFSMSKRTDSPGIMIARGERSTAALPQSASWTFSNPLPNPAKSYKIDTLSLVGLVAQRLEQRTHNPLVPGSNPGEPTN
jgi:hypothetical protein